MRVKSCAESRLYNLLRTVSFMVLMVVGASGQYRFDHWTTDDGLPQNSISGLTRASDGYLWMTTRDGLVRFDGVRFTVFNKQNTPGIPDNRFKGIYEDSRLDLWAMTEQHGVVRLHDGVFTSYGEADGLTETASGIMSEDADGRLILLLVPSGRIVRFEEDKFVQIDPAVDLADTSRIKRRQTRIFDCATGDDTRLSGVLKATQCIIDGQMVPMYEPVGGGVQLPDGSAWLSTVTNQLLEVKDRKVVRTIEPTGERPWKNVAFVTGFDFRVIGRKDDGTLLLNDPRSMTTEQLRKPPPPGLPAVGDIFAPPPADAPYPAFYFYAYMDDEENLWFATDRDGLYRARKRFITSMSTAEGLSDNNVYPVFEDPADGKIWVGMTFGAAYFENGRFRNFNILASPVDSIGKGPDGRILIGTGGVLRVRDGAGFVPFLQGRLPVRQGLNAIHTDRENALWVGGDGGLTRIVGDEIVNFEPGGNLAENDVKVIINAREGGLWIGAYAALYRYKDGRFTRWTAPEGLRANTIRSLYEDAEGALWIGSYDSGLTRFKDGVFTQYQTADGLFDDGAFQILEDDNRNFWISSNRGIYRVRKDELNEFADGKRASVTSIAYGKSDGMLNVECNGGRSPAGIRTRDGRLLFPTQDGIAVIDPSKTRVNPNPPPVAIEDFRVENRPVEPVVLRNAVADAKSPIRVEPSQQNFEVKYTALSLIGSENLRFRYKLDGLDPDWIEAGSRRTAYYSYVPPGDYTFRVIAANSDGIWNNEGKSFRIRVLPPFYRTWWFWGLSGLIVFGVTYFGYQRRIAGIERQRLAQQNFSRQLIASQEAERKRIAGELHDSLGQRLVIINNLALMFLGAKKKDDTSRIEQISAETNLAIDEVKAISYNLRPYQLDRIGLTKAIEAIVRSAQEASAIDFELEIDDIDGFFDSDNEINFYRIVQEGVSNILKHSRATEGRVEIKRSGRVLDLTISDNGRGFASVGEIDDPDSRQSKSSGFGLIGMRERAQLLGGRIAIRSSANTEGTVIQIVIKHDD